MTERVPRFSQDYLLAKYGFTLTDGAVNEIRVRYANACAEISVFRPLRFGAN